MLKTIADYLERIVSAGKPSADYDNAEVAEAVASLFKQMVLADGVVKQAEIHAAIEHLVGEYGYLDEHRPGRGIATRFSEATSESIFALASIINQSLSTVQRKQLKAQLMATALSDNEFHEYEQDMMELVDKLIKT